MVITRGMVIRLLGHLDTSAPLTHPMIISKAGKSGHLIVCQCFLQNLILRLLNDKGVKKQFNIIKSLFNKAELVINCGDAGQEGELIQRWVIKHAGYNGEIKRLWISSLTEEAIKEGFRKA